MSDHAPSDADASNPFDAMAPAYGRWADPDTTIMAELVMKQLGIEPGMRILDVGAGMGSLAVPASRLGAAVVGVDSAPAMVARMRERLAPFPQSVAKLQDMREIPFGGADYDAVVSLWCVAFFPDARDIFAKMVSSTKPGGKVAIVTWGHEAGGAVNMLLSRALRMLPGIDESQAMSAGLSQFLDPAELKEALERAGLADVEAWTIDMPNSMPAPADFLSELDGFFRILPAYAQLSAEDRTRLQSLIEAEFERVPLVDGKYVLTAPANIAIGVVPGGAKAATFPASPSN